MIRAFFISVAVLYSMSGFAQVPQGISYQAVARTTDGDELVDQSIFIRISIRQESTSGPISWQEEHAVSTNSFGLFQLIIGNGSNTGGGSVNSFSEINWSTDDHFLQVELDPGDGIYELMGITQLLSVPYALVAGRVLNNDDDDVDPTNELVQSLSISDQQLNLEQQGGTISVDLSEAVSDGDDNVGNESLTLLQLQGTILNMVESGEAFSVDLESIAEDGDWVNDVDGTIYNQDDRVGIGTADPESSFHVEGSISHAVFIHSTEQTLLLGESHHIIICDVNSGNRQISLPPAANAEGREYIIKKIDTSQAPGNAITNTVNIFPQDLESIDRESQLLLDSLFREEVTIVSDGSEWWIISRSKND